MAVVLIAHEANGLDDYHAGRPVTLADHGYVAFAHDYHGDRRVFTNREEMCARLEELGSDVERIQTLARAGLDVLLTEPKVDPSNVAAIGFCCGERLVMDWPHGGRYQGSRSVFTLD